MPASPMHQEVDESVETAWCQTCGRMSQVQERFDETVNEYHGQRGVEVTALACGHDLTHDNGNFYPW